MPKSAGQFLERVLFLFAEPLCVYPTWNQGRKTQAHPRRSHRPGHHHLRLRGQVQKNVAGGRHPRGEWLFTLCDICNPRYLIKKDNIYACVIT